MLTQVEIHYFHHLEIRKQIKSRGRLINEIVSKFSLCVPKMSKRSRDIEWSKISGALSKPKRLHIEKDEEDGLFHCPVPTCNQHAFVTQRKRRKHVKKNHPWFYYFDEQPDLSQTNSMQIHVTNKKRFK